MLYGGSTLLELVKVLSRKMLLAVIVLVIALVVIIGANWVLISPKQPLELSTQEQVREDFMVYIKTSHPETEEFMGNLAWTGGRTTTQGVGSEKYTYTGIGWNVTIRYPVVPNPIYTVTVDYSATAASSGASIPYRVIWEGTWDNGTITETSYGFAQ
jgi:hypothetical protein